MNADIYALSVPSQRKAEILKISDCKHADNAAFLLIHLQFQSSLKILRARLQKSLCGSFALRQQDDIVRVADARYPPFQILLIELVEVDICQQRGKVSSLWRAFLSVDDHSVFHNTTSEVPLYHLNDSLVPDLFPQKVHKNLVVEGVEVFR